MSVQRRDRAWTFERELPALYRRVRAQLPERNARLFLARLPRLSNPRHDIVLQSFEDEQLWEPWDIVC